MLSFSPSVKFDWNYEGIIKNIFLIQSNKYFFIIYHNKKLDVYIVQKKEN